MTQVRQTSLSAFDIIIEDGTRKSQSTKIIELLSTFPDGMTREEIRDNTNIMYSSVCGRVNDLLKAGLVYENDNYTKINNSGKKAYIVRLMR